MSNDDGWNNNSKLALLVVILVAFLGLMIFALLSNDIYGSNTELPNINSSEEYSKMVIKTVLFNTDKEIVKHISKITVINRGGYNPCRNSIASKPDGCITKNYENAEIYLIAIDNWNDDCSFNSPKFILNHEIGHIVNYYRKNLSDNTEGINTSIELEADNYSLDYRKKYENCKPQIIFIP